MKHVISLLTLVCISFIPTISAQVIDSASGVPIVETIPSSTSSVATATTFTQTAALSNVSSCTPIPKNAVLKKGVQDGKNKNVLKLQLYLAKAGYLKATPNGYFGNGTHNAVRAFQKKHGFMVTGIVGPYTLAKINELSCASSEAPEVVNRNTETTVSEVVVAPKAIDTISDGTGPAITSFTVSTDSSGVAAYSARIKNVDAVSIKAVCPPGIVEVKSSIGLTKIKVSSADSVCSKEKYLYLSDSNRAGTFERVNSQMVYIDRDGVPSWLAIDASTTPSNTVAQYKVKACLASACVEKIVNNQVADYFQKVMSTDLSLEDVKVDASQKLYLTARNFSQITVRAGCPYNTEAVDANGTVLTDEGTPCNVEKDIVAKQSANMSSYEKPEGVPLKDFGFNFQMKSINGQTDMYSNIELTVKACIGDQADTVSSTTLRCAEKKTYLPVYKK